MPQSLTAFLASEKQLVKNNVFEGDNDFGGFGQVRTETNPSPYCSSSTTRPDYRALRIPGPRLEPCSCVLQVSGTTAFYASDRRRRDCSSSRRSTSTRGTPTSSWHSSRNNSCGARSPAISHCIERLGRDHAVRGSPSSTFCSPYEGTIFDDGPHCSLMKRNASAS